MQEIKFKVDRKIYNEFGEEQLAFYRNLTTKEKHCYRMHLNHFYDSYVSPEEWFHKFKKKTNKIESYILEVMGEKALIEYYSLENRTKYNYYVYLKRRENISHISPNMMPLEWYSNKEYDDNSFRDIADKLEIPVYKVVQLYKNGMRKIRYILKSDPSKYREWNEFFKEM